MPRLGYLGGERIVGDLGPGPRDAAQERALAGVRLADQADVGDHLQLEPQVPALAFFAGREVARGLIGGRLEARVAFAAFAAAGRDHALARRGEVLEQQVVLGVDDHRAGRDEDHQIVGACAVALASCRPARPASARQCLRCASADRLSTPGSATTITLPPSPPSPPSGPPRGMYFSRRKLTQPSPPRPASTSMVTRSTNMG